MPIFEYKCLKCGYTIEKIEYSNRRTLNKCPKCGGWTTKVPSVPGFRRDHTLVEK